MEVRKPAIKFSLTKRFVIVGLLCPAPEYIFSVMGGSSALVHPFVFLPALLK